MLRRQFIQAAAGAVVLGTQLAKADAPTRTYIDVGTIPEWKAEDFIRELHIQFAKCARPLWIRNADPKRILDEESVRSFDYPQSLRVCVKKHEFIVEWTHNYSVTDNGMLIYQGCSSARWTTRKAGVSLLELHYLYNAAHIGAMRHWLDTLWDNDGKFLIDENKSNDPGVAATLKWRHQFLRKTMQENLDSLIAEPHLDRETSDRMRLCFTDA